MLVQSEPDFSIVFSCVSFIFLGKIFFVFVFKDKLLCELNAIGCCFGARVRVFV